MSFDEIRDRLKETYKTRRCTWCKKPCKDCDPKCQCLYCKFHDSFDSLGGDYQHIKDWIMNNLKFYEKLYVKGLAEENILIRKWKKRQLFTIERSGTRILDWTADYEIIEVPKANHQPPEGYRIITPYHDFRKAKDLLLNYCQICGRDIDYDYYIKHDKEKLCICIGHECATAFCLADVIVQNLKNHMRLIIEKEFKKLEKPLKKSLKEKIKLHPPNEARFKRNLERITRHFGKGKFSISAQNIAKLLLELNKDGIRVFDNKKVQKNHVKPTIGTKSEKATKLEAKTLIKKDEEISNTPEEKVASVAIIIDKNLRILIFEKIKKMSGMYQSAVKEDKIMQEMQMHGISKNEIIEYLKDMLERKYIYEFLPHEYKIPNSLF